MSSVRVRVPATSANLGPGFDAFGLAFQLYNEISISALPMGQEPVVIHSADAPAISRGRDNIAWIAAQRLLEEKSFTDETFQLQMWNSIPLSRGLGSSAAARVGALVAANKWAAAWGRPESTNDELLAIATELEGHPDNAAAALLGGFVASITGKANNVRAIKVPVRQYPRFLVWSPDAELATKAARAVLPETVPHRDAVFNLSRAALLVAAFSTGDYSVLPEALQDRLHQPQRSALIAGWDELQNAAVTEGAYGMTLSGAGSSLLFWLPSGDAVIEARVKKALLETTDRLGQAGELRALSVDEGGAVVID